MVKLYTNYSMQYRKFVRLSLLILLLFSLFHALTWSLFTSKIFDLPPNRHVGDLARLSYQIQFSHPRVFSEHTQPILHIPGKNWDHTDVNFITIGDSYSQGAGKGINSYYQDFLASNQHAKVLNILPNKGPDYAFEFIIGLINNGFFDRYKTDAVLIESVERAALKRLSKSNIDWSFTLDDKAINQALSLSDRPSIKKKEQNIRWINTGNYAFWINKLCYNFSSDACGRSSVLIKDLNTSLFSNTPGNAKLLFYKDDIDAIPQANALKTKLLNENLNLLAQKLANYNVRLYFMPVVDKYNLYSKYIINNPYPPSQFFENLRPLKKSYTFIDTKSILSSMLPQTKDLFYIDDTHWSHKAAEVIGQIPHMKAPDK